uniref:30S ribosomal protein S2 n=1 Tax=Phaeostrophion irregulare TaxID=243268 RepID=UPI002E76C6CF|nr:30S ribosomal protein S2 [Phaeostrophion irregulare]WAM64352.1 30S ribosomal protein S2 [Phaeostrophion irregulare]
MPNIELAQLLDAGVHFGHKAQRWNPKMFPYIYAERNGVHILDLVQTTEFLKRACDFSKKAARRKQTFLFVGTKKQSASLIASEAQRCDAFYVNHRWLGGMLTNWVTIKDRIKRLKDLEEQEKNDSFKNLPKKEVSNLKKELEKLKKYFSGVKEMRKVPDIIIIIDQKREIIAIQEALSLNIPIISILDTNCDPNLATLPIPGNDDAISSIKYIIKNLVDSICLGQQNLPESSTTETFIK